MSALVLLGDCIEQMATLEAGSVQCCVTSPPYWGLRDYGHAGQIGLESTPQDLRRQAGRGLPRGLAGAPRRLRLWRARCAGEARSDDGAFGCHGASDGRQDPAPLSPRFSQSTPCRQHAAEDCG